MPTNKSISVQLYSKVMVLLFFGPLHPLSTRRPHKPLVVNGVLVGPFEEEEEGTGVTSEVEKVKGEDSATAGPLPYGMTPGP